MYTTVQDKAGAVLFHKNLPNSIDALRDALLPFRGDVVVGVESTFNWYWLADACRKEGIPFHLGHALYMKAVHGGKNKNDRIDSRRIADLLRSNLFPMAYVYPPEMRGVRDLLRRRRYYVDLRASAYRHIKMVFMQQGLIDVPLPTLNKRKGRESILRDIQDPVLTLTLATDIRVMNDMDQIIDALEQKIESAAKHHDRQAFELLKTIPGVGNILALTLLYEIHTISRFPSPQKFSSYCRLVKPERTSNGKATGFGNDKIGNAELKWAFTQIIIHGQLSSSGLKALHEKMKKKHGEAKAKSILGHRFAIAVFHMLKNGKGFDEKKFLGG
jgi:transposase